jgi:hypothetical protein
MCRALVRDSRYGAYVAALMLLLVRAQRSKPRNRSKSSKEEDNGNANNEEQRKGMRLNLKSWILATALLLTDDETSNRIQAG